MLALDLGCLLRHKARVGLRYAMKLFHNVMPSWNCSLVNSNWHLRTKAPKGEDRVRRVRVGSGGSKSTAVCSSGGFSMIDDR